MTSALAVNRPSSVNEHMTKLQMRILQQKMENEREGHGKPQRNGDEEVDRLDPNRIRYHQSMLKRQELLECLKANQMRDRVIIGRPYQPPSSHPGELVRAPSRGESLPEIRGNERERRPTRLSTHREPGSRFVADQCVEEPAYQPPRHTEALNSQQRPYPPPPVYSGSQVPTYLCPPHPAFGMTGPLLLPLTTNSPQTNNNKSEYFDMMMMQNAQMHQMFMQQLMMQGLRPHSRQEPQTVVVEQQPPLPLPPPPPPQPQYITLPKNKRPKSKHHHHYSQLPPLAMPAAERPYQINHIQHVEEGSPVIIQPRRLTPEIPRETTPYQKVKPRARPMPAPHIPLPAIKPKLKHPFPGSDALRKLRHIFYAAWFVAFLRIAARKKKEKNASPDDHFIFGIQLKEVVGALHRIYLNPDGNIHPLLQTTISPGAEDLRPAFTGNQKSLTELVHLLENIIFHMTDIMPKTGVLGTYKNTAVYEMIQSGKKYPDGYFWKVEQEVMPLDAVGKTTTIDDSTAQALLLGMFMSRSLITTLLMKPLDYGLSTVILDEIAEANLKILSSILIHIVRKISVSKAKMLPPPVEVSKYLYTDEELKPLLSKIKPTMEYADELLRDWTREYVRRLREAK